MDAISANPILQPAPDPNGRFFGLRCVGLAVAALALTPRLAAAQLLAHYYPANVPAYQDWTAGNAVNELDASYRPLGITLGSFVVRPNLTESIGYDSNITGSATNRGSTELENSAGLAINSDWSRDAVNVSLSVDDVRYLDDPQRSYTNWVAGAGGVIDISDDRVQVGYLHINTVSLPSDVGTFNLVAPIVDVVDDLRISDTIGTGRLTLVPSLDGQIYRYQPLFNSPLNGQATEFDRDAATASLTLGYQFAGGHNLLMILSDSHVVYEGGGVAALPDYDDAAILVGVEYRVSGLLAYRALVGYERRFQSGTAAGGGSIAAPAAELDVIWTPTALTTVTGQISQSLENEPTAPAQGLTETNVGLILDDQIRRNVKLEVSAGYDRAAFPAGGQTESSIMAGAQATWYLNRRLSFSLRYNFSKDDSSGLSSLRFDRSTVFLQAGFQL